MLKEYKEYIENIRNNLIQNDIQVPEYELKDYADVFKYSLILEQVCWFYQMLLLMNSEYAIKGKFLYAESYQEKIRQLAYKDFMVYKESYKQISSKYQLLEELKSKVSVEEQGYEDEDEEIDLFGSEEENNEESLGTFLDIDTKSDESEIKNIQEDSNLLENIVELNKLDGTYVSHGVFIDEYQSSSEQQETEENENNMDYVPNGIFIDMFISKKEDDVYNGEDSKGSVEVHGIYIDEWVSNKYENNYSEHGIFIDEYVKKVESLVIEEGYQEHGLFIDEWVKDEKDSVSGELNESSDWLGDEEWSDSWSDEWSEEPIAEDDEYEDAEEDEWSQDGDFNGVSEEYTPKETSRVTKDVKVNKSDPTRDVSDSIQDITNQLLTEGKRLMYKGIKKLQE